MEDIAKSMSTRYIGHFPKNLEDLVELVAAADRELVILADCVDYGCYSNPEKHEEFLDEVMKACGRKVKVRLLVYGDELATKALHQQFDPKDFDETKKSAQFKHYFDTYPGIGEPAIYDDFLNILRKRETLVKTQLLERGVEIRLLRKEEQLFFWLEDDEDAVFSYENIGAGDPLCFRTRDAKLIETFKAIFDANWNAPEPRELEATMAAQA